MAKKKWISLLALCGSVLAFSVIALGAFTRLIDAGLGCPDWPGCYGHLLAPLTEEAQSAIAAQFPGSHLVVYKAWAEMVHRYFAGSLSMIILIMLMMTINKECRQRNNMVLVGGLLLLLLYQVLLGQWTVTFKLLPIVVTQHLLGGFLILSVMWLIFLNNASDRRFRSTTLVFYPIARQKKLNLRYIFIGALVGLIILFIQILLGAWTSTNYASLSCPDFPFCFNEHPLGKMYFREAFALFSPSGVNYEGGILPDIFRQTIHMTHRAGAFLLTGYMVAFTVFAMPRLKSFPELLKLFYIVLGLFCIQLCIGMSNVIFKLPLVTALSHNLIASLLLLTMITFIYRLLIVMKKAVVV